MNPHLHGELDSSLSAVVSDMQRAVEQLAQALEAERVALAASDSEALDHAGARKQANLLQLEQLDAERQQLSRELPPASTAVEPQWAQVVQSLRNCQQLNLRNGSTVNQRLGQVRQALSILTGHTGENGLYGPTGGLQASLRSQVLARA